jgi:hypothetical protein
LLALLLVLRFELPPYDDALFFGRFAQNLMDHGVYAWNVADGPVHGNTSQLFQALVTAVAAVAGGYTVAVTRVSLAASLLVGAWALGRRWPDGRPAVALALLSPVALATALSGMETALVIALASLFVAGLERGGWRSAALAWALYLARPDTAILTLGALALRRGPWRARVKSLAVVGAGLAVILLALWAYYGSVFPLSFYVKSGATSLYDADFLAKSAAAKQRHALLFALTAAPLLFAAAFDRSRAWRLAAPALAFIGYHLLFTIDVMGLHGRFFAPSLPALAAAAAAAWPALRSRSGWRAAGALLAALGAAMAVGWSQGALPTMKGWVIGEIAGPIYVACWLATAAALWPGRWRAGVRGGAMLAATAGGLLCAWPLQAPGDVSDRGYVERLRGETTSWRGIVALRRCLGPDIHLYHSEIGVPGAMFPDGRITDLGGLMNSELTLGGADLDAICLRDQPEAIFLPHRNYARLNAALRGGRCLDGYTRVVERGSSPLYVRADQAARYDCP